MPPLPPARQRAPHRGQERRPRRRARRARSGSASCCGRRRSCRRSCASTGCASCLISPPSSAASWSRSSAARSWTAQRLAPDRGRATMAVPRPVRTHATPGRTLGARGAYRRWYAAAGPWAGFFRAVPLVAVARGVLAPRADAAETAAADQAVERLAATLADAGRAEGWLGQPEVLLLLDLPGPLGVSVAARLAPAGVRPVLLSLLW